MLVDAATKANHKDSVIFSKTYSVHILKLLHVNEVQKVLTTSYDYTFASYKLFKKNKYALIMSGVFNQLYLSIFKAE